MKRGVSSHRAAVAAGVTALCWVSGGLLLRTAYHDWRAYHRVAAVELRPDGVEQTLPVRQGPAGLAYRLVVRGALLNRESGTLYDATEVFSRGSTWTHGALELSPPDLVPTDQFRAPHKQVYLLREGTELAGIPVRVRLNPDMLYDEDGWDSHRPPQWEGSLRAELWERDGEGQARWALFLGSLAALCLGWGAVRLHVQWPRRRYRRLPARGSEADRLLRGIRRARREALVVLASSPVGGLSGLRGRVEALAAAAEELAIAAQVWSEVREGPGRTASSPGQPDAGETYGEHLRRLREIHALLALFPARFATAWSDPAATAEALGREIEEELEQYRRVTWTEVEEQRVQQLRVG